MGIPSFYRWLVDRYPLTLELAIEEFPTFVNGVTVMPDISKPNPNGVEFDNLYLDMNGIIHPCFHPEGLLAPKTYDEVFKAVFKYIDKIFSIVRPRKLLYLAIDGVAPRAKMNQQRSRRFRAAKQAAYEAEIEKKSGISKVDGENLDTEKLDSNVITPGTEFMAALSSALRYYVHLRMNEDPGWKGIKVILSDASVPGEGEHKIMSYIRLQRNLPGFDPNTKHCLYGLDADLIMLALATHEIHFSILREETSMEHKNISEKRRDWKRDTMEGFISKQKFQFLKIWVLRNYLAHELKIRSQITDLERLIDDFVFMCLFVGNDFLPHIPSLEISEGAIDLLMIIYKKEFVRMGGYLTDSSEVNLKRVEHFVKAVASHEKAIFMKRNQETMRMAALVHQKKKRTSTQPNSLSSVQEIQTDATIPTPEEISDMDKVKLGGKKGWEKRYYTQKFVDTSGDLSEFRKQTVSKYIEGICWVMHYYYEGVCSWQWFYPYHYAPLASDMCDLDKLEITFELGKPFKPLDQLMAVLPAASAHALPLSYRKLMINPSSPLLDYYPRDFKLDMNGKRHEWQAICLLPFIKESRLLMETADLEHTLTDEEKQRNSLGLDMLFVHISHPLSVDIFLFREKNKDHPKLAEAKVKRKIDPISSGGMNGYIYISDKPVAPVEILPPIDDMKMISNNKVMSVFYKYPSFHPHIPRPPEGVIMPAESVKKRDLKLPPIMWHDVSVFAVDRLTARAMPKCVSGASLSKIAHQLVCEYYTAMQQERENGGSVDKDENLAVNGNNIDGDEGKKKKEDEVSGGLDIDGNQTITKKRKRKQKKKKNMESNVGSALATNEEAKKKPNEFNGVMDEKHTSNENNIDGNECRKRKQSEVNGGLDADEKPEQKRKKRKKRKKENKLDPFILYENPDGSFSFATNEEGKKDNILDEELNVKSALATKDNVVAEQLNVSFTSATNVGAKKENVVAEAHVSSLANNEEAEKENVVAEANVSLTLATNEEANVSSIFATNEGGKKENVVAEELGVSSTLANNKEGSRQNVLAEKLNVISTLAKNEEAKSKLNGGIDEKFESGEKNMDDDDCRKRKENEADGGLVIDEKPRKRRKRKNKKPIVVYEHSEGSVTFANNETVKKGCVVVEDSNVSSISTNNEEAKEVENVEG